MDDLRATIVSAARRFVSDVVLHHQAVAQEVGLGGSDAQFLGLLGRHGPLTPGRLAALSGLTTGTVTGVIDRLELAGFVRRERDATDRRKVLVVPEPSATATLAEHYREHAERLDEVLAARSPEELRTIAAFLDDLLAPGSRPGRGAAGVHHGRVTHAEDARPAGRGRPRGRRTAQRGRS